MAAKKDTRKTGADTHIALLRGINVGGKNMLPMKELVAMFERAGCGDVRSYIQSGNVVFTAKPTLARRLPGLITKAIFDDYEYEIPIVMRTAAELESVASNNPFLKSGEDTKALYVAFLSEKPSKAAQNALDPDRSPPDEFALSGGGREIYLNYLNGAGRTKLNTQYLDSRLKMTSTIRNWRTVLKLVEMTRKD